MSSAPLCGSPLSVGAQRRRGTSRRGTVKWRRAGTGTHRNRRASRQGHAGAEAHWDRGASGAVRRGKGTTRMGAFQDRRASRQGARRSRAHAEVDAHQNRCALKMKTRLGRGMPGQECTGVEARQNRGVPVTGSHRGRRNVKVGPMLKQARVGADIHWDENTSKQGYAGTDAHWNGGLVEAGACQSRSAPKQKHAKAGACR